MLRAVTALLGLVAIVPFFAAPAATGRSPESTVGSSPKGAWADLLGGSAGAACDRGGCFRFGWSSALAGGGEAVASCAQGDCLRHGWVSRLPSGAEAVTRCRARGCMAHGWEIYEGVEQTAIASCLRRDCARYGWTTRYADGSELIVRCDGGACLQRGWSAELRRATRPPESPLRAVPSRCRCNRRDCNSGGVDCAPGG